MSDFEGILETGGAAAAELAVAAVAARNAKPNKPCPNCDAEMTGAYCAMCGQERDTHRRTVWRLIKDYTEDLISFDSRVLRTLRALLFQPGELPLAFREGRTQRYVPAIRLYLFVSLLSFLFLSATGVALMQFSMQVQSMRLTHDAHGDVLQIVDGKTVPLQGMKADAQNKVFVQGSDGTKTYVPGMRADGDVSNNISAVPVFFQRIGSVHSNLSPAQKKIIDGIGKDEEAELKRSDINWFVKGIYTATQKLQTNPAALNGPLMTWIPRILFILLPLYAMVLFLFYIRQRKSFYFVDHLVFSLSVHTAAFVILVMAAIAAQVIDGPWIGVFVFLSLAAYVLLAMKRFYAQGWRITVVKYLAVGSLYFMFLLGPALGLAVVASMIWT
jgi:hypothetical protein